MIPEDPIVQNTIDYVRKELAQAEGGHDWFHVERVYNNALHIAKTESVDTLVVALAALLHDIADYKFHDGDDAIGPAKAKEFLETQTLETSRIEHVIRIIENVSYQGGNAERTFHSKELEVVQDADRLDAIGAIGIARTFNYGGYKNRKLYDPAILPKLVQTPEEYKNSEAPTINHFYEKLLLLKDLMHTKTAKQIAEKRHHFMEMFLDQFYQEWRGEA